jgi:erythronate-4-phosphate dehydrogenase
MNYAVLADENIPYAKEAFSFLGDVQSMAGRDMASQHTEDIDILMVRSVTKVNETLLEKSRVKFVGTATIGTDHVDTDYLAERDICFASAPGCNANSVSEYITAILLEMAITKGFSLKNTVLGIVGVGNVGSLVEEKVKALGMDVILNDPPLKDETGDPKYRSLEEVFEADIISLHVPLTKEEPYPTFHMADKDFFNKMGTGKGFINASRGSVVDENALVSKLDTNELLFCALDVWEHEPDIYADLADKIDIGTPHIAGYSFEGKLNGTNMVYQAACDCFDMGPEWDYAEILKDKQKFSITLNQGYEQDLLAALKLNYDIIQDDAMLRQAAHSSSRGEEFDGLRKNYRKRREFTNSVLSLSDDSDQAYTDILKKLKFTVL